MIVRLELNSSEKLILCTGDTSATYKLSDIPLQYDAIFDEPYPTNIGKMHTGTTSIPYTKVGSIHYQTLSKKDTTWKIDVNNLSFGHCRVYLYYSLTNVMTLSTKTLQPEYQENWRLDYRQGKFIQNLKNIFIKKTLM